MGGGKEEEEEEGKVFFGYTTVVLPPQYTKRACVKKALNSVYEARDVSVSARLCVLSSLFPHTLQFTVVCNRVCPTLIS